MLPSVSEKDGDVVDQPEAVDHRIDDAARGRSPSAGWSASRRRCRAPSAETICPSGVVFIQMMPRRRLCTTKNSSSLRAMLSISDELGRRLERRMLDEQLPDARIEQHHEVRDRGVGVAEERDGAAQDPVARRGGRRRMARSCSNALRKR